MSYEIQYDKQPAKFLEKLEKQTAKRILDKIDELTVKGPVPSDAKRIVGEHGVYRIRIGDYRALYRISYQDKLIIVFKIGKREDVY